MRYGISNWIYGDEPLETTFDRLQRYGYGCVELVGEPEQYSPEQVRALSEEHQVSVSSVLGWCLASIPGRDLADQNDEARAAAIQYSRDCIDLAAGVGAPILVVIPAAAGRTSPVGNPADQSAWESAYRREWACAVDSVKQAAKYASKRGIELAIEPINRYETFLVTNLDQAFQFIEDVGADNVKIHLDTFHMNLEEPGLASAVKRAGAWLVNMHVADSNRQAPGRGHIDFAALLTALRAVDYKGVLVLEPVPPGSNPLLVSRFPMNQPLRDIYAEEGIFHLTEIEAEL